MIFVSYSHKDEVWREGFETIAKPLNDYDKLECWSDRKLKIGNWRQQIQAAMEKATIAVFLVSDHFVASNFIMKEEVPYFLKAHNERNLQIVWAYIAPCLREKIPEITKFQAMTLDGNLEPAVNMDEYGWKETFCNGCRMIDAHLKELEQPIIHAGVRGRLVAPQEKNFRLLSRPAKREVEVLVYAGNKRWYRQSPISPGSLSTTCQFGDEHSRSGSEYQLIALTSDRPLPNKATYQSIPKFRTQSNVVTVKLDRTPHAASPNDFHSGWTGYRPFHNHYALHLDRGLPKADLRCYFWTGAKSFGEITLRHPDGRQQQFPWNNRSTPNHTWPGTGIRNGNSGVNSIMDHNVQTAIIAPMVIKLTGLSPGDYKIEFLRNRKGDDGAWIQGVEFHSP